MTSFLEVLFVEITILGDISHTQQGYQAEWRAPDITGRSWKNVRHGLSKPVQVSRAMKRCFYIPTPDSAVPALCATQDYLVFYAKFTQH